MGKNNNSRDSYLLEYQWHLLPASAATHWHESTNMGGVNGLGPKISYSRSTDSFSKKRH